MLAGVLAWRDRGDVDADELADIPRQRRSGTGAGFFGDGEQRMAVDQWLCATVDHGLERGQQRRDPGLVVQVAGADMAAFGEFGQRVEGDEITDIDPQGLAVGAGRAVGIQTQLDVFPTDRQLVDGGIEGVPAGHQRQDATAQHTVVGEHTDPATLGKAAGPAAHRCEGQTTVVLEGAHTGSDGVQVRGNGAVG
ncbi:hypothetical protein D9M71_295870 [compost metagenome]